jgi:hypothetical protein
VRRSVDKNEYYHFSVDDVLDALIQVSDSAEPVFQHPFFRYLKTIHEQFSTNVDLYLFYRGTVNGRERTLSDVQDRTRNEFQEAEWLRFGPHALDYETPPYKQTPSEQWAVFDDIYREIDRFAGPRKRSRFVRLHYFSEAYELSSLFRDKGVDTLLLTDKDAASYRLPERARRRLLREGQLKYRSLNLLRSHFRMENLASELSPDDSVNDRFDSVVSDYGYLCLFTHEIELSKQDVRERTHECLRYASARNIRSL